MGSSCHNEWMDTVSLDLAGKSKGHLSQKKMGMEERIPTIPGMYNKLLRITRTWNKGQAYYSLAIYHSREQVVCPRCSIPPITALRPLHAPLLRRG